MTYCKVFTSPLLLLRPSLVASATPLLPPDTILTSRFMVFVVYYLNNFNCFKLIVDGYTVNWTNPRATQPNLLRGLLNISSIISPATNFILFFDGPLNDFQFNTPNLIVVPRKLTPENLFEELSPILYRRSA